MISLTKKLNIKISNLKIDDNLTYQFIKMYKFGLKNLPALMKYLFFFMFVVTLIHCKEDDGEPEPISTQLVDSELKSYYYFPEGSWWIYQRVDTNVAIFDTAIVVENFRELRFNPTRASFEWERLITNIEHSYYESAPIYGYGQLRVQFYNSPYSENVISSNSFGNIFGPYNNFLTVPIDSLTIAQNSSGYTRISELLDTTSLQLSFGKVANVVKLRIWGGSIDDTLCLAKNIGIVKFHESVNNISWELIKYEIKKN